jgi:hypothetical protein
MKFLSYLGHLYIILGMTLKMAAWGGTLYNKYSTTMFNYQALEAMETSLSHHNKIMQACMP